MAASAYLKVRSKPKSFHAVVITLVVHGVVVLFLVNLNSVKPSLHSPVMQMIYLKAKVSKSSLVANPPIVSFKPHIIHLHQPDIYFNGVDYADLTLVKSTTDIPYELPDKNNELYPDVFDPALRKKLQEAHANRRIIKKSTINSWTTSGGTTLADMGDGECIASMPKTDARDRGTSWSLLRVKCGKTDSEKMMDNITADLEARKHPLNK